MRVYLDIPFLFLFKLPLQAQPFQYDTLERGDVALDPVLALGRET